MFITEVYPRFFCWQSITRSSIKEIITDGSGESCFISAQFILTSTTHFFSVNVSQRMGAIPLFLDFFFQSTFSIPREQQQTTNTLHMISQISVIFWTDDEAHRKDFTTMLKLHLVLTPLYCPNSACFRPDISNFKSHRHKLSTKSHLDLKKSPCFTSGQLWTSEHVVGSLS